MRERMMNLKGNPFYLNDSQIEKVYNLLEHMTDKQKVGQLFCPEAGRYLPEQLETMVREYGIGGVLYRPNHSKVLKEYYEKIEQMAEIPLLHAANLEAGGIGAITDGTHFANPMGIAAADDLKITKKFALVCAVEGMQSGVNWSFSPVVDINYNPQNPITNIRAYSDDPDTVLKHATVFIKTMQDEGMAACCKHFPGDGVDFRDQHLHPTYNTLSVEDWNRTYGRVYKALIDEGVLSIMAGHICQPAVTIEENPSLRPEEVLPATLCPELLQGVLRGKLGFNGLITTDATIMAGYYQIGENRAELLVQSIMAGCDMLLFNDNFYEDYEAVLNAVEKGILSHERLDEAVLRILALKMKVCGRETQRKIEPEKWAYECADKAITLVKHTGNILPIATGKTEEIKICVFGDDGIQGGSLSQIAKDYLNANGYQVTDYDVKKDCSTDVPVLILSNYGTGSGKTAVRVFWDRGLPFRSDFMARENVIYVSFGNPYHLMDVPRVKTYINAYSANRITVEAALCKIIGKSSFTGVSPVDAFCGMIDTKL